MLKRLLFLAVALAATARAQLTINEFMAANSNSITDENGNHEDWIEIQNTSAGTVSLSGWYLTDDSNLPRAWAFPNWTLSPGAFIVVFASGKDRKPAQAVAGQDNSGAAGQTKLHTNFKLNNAGEYLALNKDIAGGGLQVVQFYNPYPAQATDVAYGYAVSTTSTAFVDPGAQVKVLIPSSAALGSTWQGAAANEPFNTSSWLSGTTGVGFGDPSFPVATANLKQRLNSDSAVAIVTDTSSAIHPATNIGATWVASNTDPVTKTRTGVMQFVAGEGDQVPTAGHPDFDQALCTVTFWMRSAGIAGGGNEAAMLWDRRTGGYGGPGTVITQHTNGKIFFQSANGYCQFSSIASVSDDRWHHIAVVMSNVTGGTNTIYVDGVTSGSGTNSNTWGWTASTPIELGRSHDSYWYQFNGFLDDVRFYNRQLTGTEVGQIYNGADAPVAPGDISLNVQAQMQNINASAYLRIPFNVTTPANFASVRLTNRWNDGFVAYVNGTQIAAQNAPASAAYNANATGTHGGGLSEVFNFTLPGGLLRAGSNVLAIHGLNASAADASFLMLPKLEGLSTPTITGGYTISPTPGATNSEVKTNIGPFVSDVTKNPAPRPTGTAASPALTITAKVLPSLRPLAAAIPVQLKYLVMFGSEISVNMADQGPSVGDPAGTRLYSAQIPTSTLGRGQMLRWRVVATDNTGVAGTAPEFSDPIDNEQYDGTVAVDSTIETNLPILYWFTPSATAADNDTGVRNSFFFKAIGDPGVGRFYDNVEINRHGQSSAGFSKKSYDLDFNEDNRFEWNIAEGRVKDINLLTNYGDKSKTHNVMSHEAFAIVGSVHHWCRQVRVQQVTPDNFSTPSSHFFSIADMMEDGDEDFMERNGHDPNGALYKVYDSLSGSGGAEKKSRLHENKADYDAFVAGLDIGSKTLTQRRQYAYDNMDLPQCVSYFVGCIITSHQDHGHKNFYVYRDTPGTQEWMILPWDVDLTWGRNWQDSLGYFTDTIFTNNDLDQFNGAMQGKGENRLYSLFVGNSDLSRLPATEFRDMVLRRLRTVLDGYFSAPGVLENRFAQLADLMDPPAIGNSDADRDRLKWGSWGTDNSLTVGGQVMRYHIDQVRNVYLPGRRSFLNSATLAGATVPVSQPANASTLITIETVDFKPSTNNQEHEFFVLRNANAYSVDISGWKITGAVDWTFKPGTVLPPGGGITENLGDLYVVKNPAVFRQRSPVPDDGLPAANQYRFVQGPYKGQLSARGETIELRDAAGTLLKTKTWTPAPTAAQNQLRITELNYAPVGPTPAESTSLLGVVESDFEYLEFLNTGVTPLALAGARFETGIVFTFPTFTLQPGARCLVVANLVAFQLRYGHAFDAQIAGVFAGNLDNNGESLQLLDAIGENILDFTYNNSWFPPSDEGGRTLVIRNTANPDWSTYDFPQSWALSGSIGGSPGATDTDFANVYEGWRWDYFTAAEMPTVLSPNLPAALTLDPESDGWNNLAEYAYCRHPKIHDNATPLAVASVVSNAGSNYLAITFKRRHKALDLTYTVETCGDLTNNSWAPVDIQVGSTSDLGNGVEQVTYRDNVPRAPGTKRYIRVRAFKP